MTGRGIAFAGFFALLLSAAKLTGSREIGLTALSLGLILAYSLVSALWTACCVRYRVETPSFGLIRGEGASFALYVRGFRLFPAVLYLQASLNDCTFPRCAFQLKLGEREQAFQVPVDCPHHGIWQMQLRRLKVRDLFGLFSFPPLAYRRYGRDPYPLAVYPRLTGNGESSIRLPSDTAYSEEHLIPAERGDSSAGVRAYRQGDSMKRIHWKVTAKMREMCSRQYETPADPYALVLLDYACPLAAVDDPLERGDRLCECAGEIALYYAQREETVCLRLPGMENGELRLEGQADIPALYEFLTAAPLQEKSELSFAVAEIFRHLDAIHTLYVVSDRADEELQRELSGIAHRCPVVWILPQESPEGMPLKTYEEGLLLVSVSEAKQLSVMLGEGL